MNTASLCASAALAITAATWCALPADAANATQSACSQQYQSAKSAGTLNGQKWSDFYSSCAASMKSGASQTTQPTQAATPAPAATKTSTAAAVVPAVASGLSTQQACSQQYQAAKSAGTLNGQKWSAFYSACAAALKSGAAPAQAAAPAPAPVSRTAAVVPAATTAAAASASSGHQTTQQICSGQYQSAKSAGSLNGQSWGQFLSACAANIKNYSDASAPAPTEPAAVTPAQAQTMAATPAAIPTTDANGKPLSAGEVAFRQRIHACSQEWQSEKASNTLPAGSKWPQFWSACNTQLKQQG